MTQYAELYSHPMNKASLSQYFTQTYGASLGMCKSLADVNPDLDPENLNISSVQTKTSSHSLQGIDSFKSEYKRKEEEVLETKRTEFIAEWMELNMNTYFDTIQHLVISYGNCRDEWEKKGHIYKEGRMLNNSSTDPCLKAWKKNFFAVLGKSTEFFSIDHGFYIENTETYF